MKMSLQRRAVNGNVQCISVTRAVLLNQGSKEHCHSVMFILQVP